MVPQLFSALWRNPYLLLALTALQWAANALMARLAVGEVSPMLLVAIRWWLVVALVLVTFRGALVEALPPLRAVWPRIVFMGACGYALFNVLFYLAGHATTALNIGLIQGSIPIFVVSVAFFTSGATVSLAQGAGIMLTVLGVALTASHGDLSRILELEINLGDGAMLLACLLYAGYTVALAGRPRVSATGFFGAMAIVAAFTATPFALGEWALGAAQWPTWTGWAILIFIVLFPSFLSQLTFMRAVELVGPGRAGIFVNLTPVITASMAVGLLGEPFGWHHGAAMALVLGGIALAEWGKRRG